MHSMMALMMLSETQGAKRERGDSKMSSEVWKLQARVCKIHDKGIFICSIFMAYGRVKYHEMPLVNRKQHSIYERFLTTCSGNLSMFQKFSRRTCSLLKDIFFDTF